MAMSADCVLVTGGAGYVGSHTVLELLLSGSNVVVLDNLSNGHRESLRRVDRLANRPLEFVLGDVRDQGLLEELFTTRRIGSVIHFAGLKSVSESVNQPIEYFDINVGGSIALFRAMKNSGVSRIAFSSSASIYAESMDGPVDEDSAIALPNSPYGRSKLMVEQILGDLARSEPDWSVGLLRYFNPVGAHESGLIGEDPHGTPDNLLPYVGQVASGRLPKLRVFGSDYPTRDGTGVRDYIHVVDLALGHIAALQFLKDHSGVFTWNFGTGKGYTVLEVVEAFQRVSGKQIPLEFCARRPGDTAECWSNSSRAERELGWVAKKSLSQMMADTWRWHSANPGGFSE